MKQASDTWANAVRFQSSEAPEVVTLIEKESRRLGARAGGGVGGLFNGDRVSFEKTKRFWRRK